MIAILLLVLNILEGILFAYLCLSTVYILFFAIAGRFSLRMKDTYVTSQKRIAVLIPAYREDLVIVETVRKIHTQTYPKECYTILVIADSLLPETITSLIQLSATIVEVRFSESTKVKALNAGLTSLANNFDIALVLDADNCMDPEFLAKVNRAFNSGYLAVQGHRIAKNLNTPMAILDSLSEEINNHIFRKGHRVVGLSSALIGSGMAFEYKLFKELITAMTAVGGFDKELELELFKKHIKIDYIENAWVEDEKVQNAHAFQQQRKRWLSAQWNYLRNYAFNGLTLQLRDQNFDYLDKVYQLFLPPRIVLLGLLTVISLITALMSLIPRSGLDDYLLIGAFPWILTWFLATVSLLLSVPKNFSRRKIFFAVRYLPWGFYLMVKSIFRLKGVNKRFLHTNHTFGSDKMDDREQDKSMQVK